MVKSRRRASSTSVPKTLSWRISRSCSSGCSAVASPGLVRKRGGRDVEVLRALAEEEIAYAAADEIGLIALATQLAHDANGVGVEERVGDLWSRAAHGESIGRG